MEKVHKKAFVFLVAAMMLGLSSPAFAQEEDGGGEGDPAGGEADPAAEGDPADFAGEGDEPPPAAAGGGGAPLRRSDRMDFDERLIKGQGARSGAIYLFKRTPRKLPELVALRTTYRSRIVIPVLGADAAARYAKAAVEAGRRSEPAPRPEKQRAAEPSKTPSPPSSPPSSDTSEAPTKVQESSTEPGAEAEAEAEAEEEARIARRRRRRRARRRRARRKRR